MSRLLKTGVKHSHTHEPLPEPGPHRGFREARLPRNTVIPLKAPRSAGSGVGEEWAGGSINWAPTICHSCLFSNWRGGGLWPLLSLFSGCGTDWSGTVSLERRQVSRLLPPGDGGHPVTILSFRGLSFLSISCHSGCLCRSQECYLE